MDEQAKSLRAKLTMLFNSLPSHQKHEYHQLTEQMDGQETQCLEVGKQTQINSSQGRIGSSDNGSSRCSRTRRSGKVLCLQMSAVNLEKDHALNTPTQILVEDKRQALSTGHSWIQRKAAKVDYGEGTRIHPKTILRILENLNTISPET